jgi:flagellar biosynthesis protein FlhB
MSLYIVKKIQLSSVLKVLPVIYVVSAALLGLFVVFFPQTGSLSAEFSFGQKMVAWIGLVVIYTVMAIIPTIIMVWLYNFVTSKLNNGIVISLEPKE